MGGRNAAQRGRVGAVIRIRGLTVDKGGRRVLEGVDLDWGKGLTLLGGANGQGKTLLCRCLLGLEPFRADSILMEDEPWSPQQARRRIGYVIQDPQRHFLGLSCHEEAALGAEGVDPTPALREMGLEAMADVPPLMLSGGEQRRLALASVLVRDCPYLILDEPFNALDRDGVRLVLRFLLEWKRKDRAVLLITHDLEKCLAYVDRVILLKGGRVWAAGILQEVWPHLEEAGLHRPVASPEEVGRCTWL